MGLVERKEMIKVLHIITDLRGGGGQSILSQLIKNSRECNDGIEHEVISLMQTTGVGDQIRAQGVSVTGLGMNRGLPGPSTMLRLYRLIKNSKADVVQTWLYHADLLGGIASRLAGVRRIFWGVHHAQGENLSPGTRLVVKLLSLLSGSVPRYIICCAETALAVHQKLGYQSGKLVCVPNGVDLTHYKPAPDVSQPRTLSISAAFEDDVFLFSCVARWHPDKDIPTLLRAISELKKRTERRFHLLIAGTRLDSSNQELQQLIDSLDLKEHVTLLGRRDDINSLFNAVKVNVLSSSSEARPGVIAESMATGTPCIVTDVGDARLMVADTGWVVPASDPKALAEAMETAMKEQNRHQREKRSQACRDRASSEFDLVVMTRQYAALWRDQS